MPRTRLRAPCSWLLASSLFLATAAQAAPVKSTQTGTTLLNAGATSRIVTLPAEVDPGKAFLVFGLSESSNQPQNGNVSGQLTGRKTLSFERSGSSGVVTINWHVVEFAGGVSVQRGSVALSATTVNVPIGTVNLTKSFPLITVRTTGVDFGSDDFVRARLTANTNLEISAGSVAVLAVAEWQVVEYQDAFVQTGSVSFAAADPSKTVPVASVNMTKSWLINSHKLTSGGTPANIGQKLVRGVIASPTTLTFDRNNSGVGAELTWYLVEFNDATTVRHASQGFLSAENVRNVTLSPAVNPAFSIAAGGHYARGGRSPYNLDDVAGVGWFTLALTSETNLLLSRGFTGATADVGWFVVEFGPEAHYRSIGIDPGVLYSVGSATVALGGSVTDFSGASLPPNVGTGDKLTLDPGGPNQEILYILRRESATRVTVETPAAMNHVSETYSIRRAYNTLQSWESDREGNLVGEGRREVGVAYNDGPFAVGVAIDGSTTDADHYMTLTVAEGQRHNGVAGSGVVVDGGNTLNSEIRVADDFSVVEWLEVKGTRDVSGGTGARVVDATGVRLSHLLVHDNKDGIGLSGTGIPKEATVRNSIVYKNDDNGIQADDPPDTLTVQNCTVYGNGLDGVNDGLGSAVSAVNTISMGNGSEDFDIPAGVQSFNISSDATASGAGSLPNRVSSNQFVSLFPGFEDLHLIPLADAIDAGTDLSGGLSGDIDLEPRPAGASWDIGADELDVATVTVEISSGASQTFTVGDLPTAAEPITLTDGNSPSITAANDIRIRIPASLHMRWDDSVTTVTPIGPGNVDPTVTYEDGGKTLVLDVLSDFLGASVTVDGLKFFNFLATSPAQSLELDVNDDATADASDDKTAEILAGSAATLASDADQVFLVGPGSPSGVPIFVTDGAPASITTVGDIHVVIPMSLSLTWNTSVTPTLSGNAWLNGRLGTISYQATNRPDDTLRIEVVSNFVGGEYFVITGYQFASLTVPGGGSLELEINSASIGPEDLDDKTITLDVLNPVQFFTARATGDAVVGDVKLEWVNPQTGFFFSTKVLRTEEPAPCPSGPNDGAATLVYNDGTVGWGAKDFTVDPGLTHDKTYCYVAFVDANGNDTNFSTGLTVKARPFDATATQVKWAYSMGATSMAAPGIRIEGPALSTVYQVSNDNILHRMNGGPLGGDWPAAWKPYRLSGASQIRPPIYPYAVQTAPAAAFVTSQDGTVYAIDAEVGSELWNQPAGGSVTGAPAGHFSGFHPAGTDLVLFGTRDGGTAANQFRALDRDFGTLVWSFTNSVLQGGTSQNIGPINGGAAVDYHTTGPSPDPTKPRVYFASRKHATITESQDTLWSVEFGGLPTRLWSATTPENIDATPILHGGTVYVGTVQGKVYAFLAETGAPKWLGPYDTMDMGLKGFIFPQFGTNNLLLSTETLLWSLRDNGGSVTKNWDTLAIGMGKPSTPLVVPGTNAVLVGSDNGRLYQLNATTGSVVGFVQLGDGLSGVGAPSFDVANGMILVGSEAGIIYGVAFPLP